MRKAILVCGALVVLAAACGDDGGGSASTTTTTAPAERTTTTTEVVTTTTAAGTTEDVVLADGRLVVPGQNVGDVDLTRLPVGDDSLVDSPEVGGLYLCPTFPTDGGGAQVQGPWFNGDGTYDSTKKTTVDGDVKWPDAKFTKKTVGDNFVFTTNDEPISHTTGTFPIASTDDAYQVDRNPNSIKPQSITVTITRHPKMASQASCAGELGILKSGVVLFAPVDAQGRDAVAYEVQDHCQGHPQEAGEYHYHSASSCVLAKYDTGTGQSKQIGWAFDGFGIYGPRGADGKELTNADLDECHGITSTVVFNGKKQKIYHYVATKEFPYTIGCFRGTSTLHGPTVQNSGNPQHASPTGVPPRNI